MRPRPSPLLVLLACVSACARPYLPLRADAPAYPPVPDSVVHATSTFAGRGDVPLFAQAWRPAAGDVRGVLVIMHGLRDHGDHYAVFAATLCARGYAVYAFDLRGHGRSAGRRVSVDSFDDYVADLDAYLERVRAAEPGKPLFVYGHSMGGAIVARWAELQELGAQPAGIVLSAPALRIDLPPIAAAGILLAATLTPNAGGLAPDNDGFSSDPAVTADMDRDPLIYQPAGPVGTARQLVDGIELFWAHVDRLRAPLLLLHGTADKLTAPAGSREIYTRARSRDKTLRLYPGLYHDLVHEPKRDQVIADVLVWLDAHTGGPPAEFPAPDLTTPLPGEGNPPSLALALEGQYLRRHDDENEVGAALRTRVLFSDGGYALGLDASAGAAGGDFVYRAVAYPLGFAFLPRKLLLGDQVSISAGGGVSDAGGGLAGEADVSADWASQYRWVRMLAWLRYTRIFGDDTRKDEWHLGLAFRLGRNHRYWSTTNAGTGPYLGYVQTRHDDNQWDYGLVLGLDLWGGH